MLAEFAFSGYRSFRERCVFSMKAEARSENSDSLIDGKYLPVSVLYGPDGSGKSSVINAVRAVAESVSLPLLSSGSGIGALCAPFAGTALPSFMIEYTSGDSIYRYSIAASNDEIISESLERKGGDEKRFSLLFSRDSDDIRYHGLFRSIGAGEVPSDVPLLTILASEHPENAVVTEAYRGIADGFTFPSVNDSFDASDKVLVSIVRELGLGIEDVISKDGRTGLSYGSYSVPLSEESQGIQEIFALLPSVMRALRSGSTLLLDSPLPTVHPAVLEYIIHLFTEKESNIRGASLVFSTNAVSIMDIRNFRRDEIWLAEKKDGESALRRLSSIKDSAGQYVRKDARFARNYAEGAYGAWQETGKIIRWEGEKERRSDERRFFSINNRRYLGNKFRITRFIREIADKNCPDASSFADIFSGTGSVSYAFRDKRLILNDFLYSNYLANIAWFSPERFDEEKVTALIDSYNGLVPCGENYMSENFSDTYFSHDNCVLIGMIREDIESRYRKGEINLREKAILVTSLLYAMDRIAATCGHYDAWRRGADLSAGLDLRMLDAGNDNNAGNEIFSEDTNALVRHISADIVYIDPPYNSRQYSDSYHLLENVARWEKPAVRGTARKMDRKGMKSLYSTTRAPETFSDLIKSIDAKYILLSYNNMHDKGDSRSNAKITDDEIMTALSAKGDVTVFSTSHKAFSAGKSRIEGNEERIFLCRVRRTSAGKARMIESPLNYVGGKGRILDDLLAAFPKEIDTFVDFFAGGCSVGVNVPCRRVIFNDSDARLMGLIREMRKCGSREFISGVSDIISEYGLSRSDEYGYAYYGADSSKGLGAVNKEAYLRLRNDFNTLAGESRRRAEMLYVLIVYGFNNQIRFNDDGFFNLPVGKRDFNRRMQEKLSLFMERLQSIDAVLLDSDFRTVEIPSGSFVYADPPYLITTATYNEKHGWTENDEKSLHDLLEDLDRRGIGFALSNTLRSRGRENTYLISWLEKHPEYRVIHIDRSYANSNYHLKERDAASDEVLITNR